MFTCAWCALFFFNSTVSWKSMGIRAVRRSDTRQPLRELDPPCCKLQQRGIMTAAGKKPAKQPRRTEPATSAGAKDLVEQTSQETNKLSNVKAVRVGTTLSAKRAGRNTAKPMARDAPRHPETRNGAQNPRRVGQGKQFCHSTTQVLQSNRTAHRSGASTSKHQVLRSRHGNTHNAITWPMSKRMRPH